MTSAHIDNTTIPEKWSTASDRYQERIGATTSYGAARIVQLVNTYAPFQHDSFVLDVGTGTGSIPVKIRDKAPAGTRILATDISNGMLDQVNGLKLHNTTTQLEDAITLAGLEDNSFSHVFTSFAIQFTPDPPATIKQMYRVLKPSGMAGIVIWGDYAGPSDIHDRACRMIRPEYRPADPNVKNAWSSKSEHLQHMEQAGFKDVTVEACLLPFYCNSGKHFCEYWFGYNNPVPGKPLQHAKEQGIDPKQLEAVIEQLVDEEYEHGKGVYFTAVLGWGTR